jgi:transposase
MHDRVAAIDVHKDMVKVAVRVPGERRGTRKTDVLEFRTFYGVLEEMGRELRRRGVTHVVMEASGVYTDPVYYALRELGFAEVMVINPAHAKALKGHKTDAKDAPRRSSGCRKRWRRPGSSCPRSCPMLPGARRQR